MRTTRTSLGGSGWSVLGTLPSEWRLRRLGEVDLDSVWPAFGPWYPATVPGDVQSDLVDAGVLADPRIGTASRDAEWVSARDWLYRRSFRVHRLPGARVQLLLEGVDERCAVFVDGTGVGEHGGFAEPFLVDVTDALSDEDEHDLRIIVEHAPMPPVAWGAAGRTGDVRAWKPRLSYGWDFAPRLVPVGLWGDVVLIVTPDARLVDVHVRASAAGRLVVAVEATGGDSIEVELTSHDGSAVTLPSAAVVGGRATVSVHLPDVELWWPAGQGSQPLYTVTTRLLAQDGELLDEDVRRTGFRTVTLAPVQGAAADALPYTLEVNDRRIPIRGWNWVPVDVLYGRRHDDSYDALLQLAADAHCNLLRVWGGGLPERPRFYDRCDELGLLVWQEFLLSSSGDQNSPPTDDEHLALCRRAAASIVRGRRSHPALAVWCAGNELYDDDFVPEPPDHPVLTALADTVRELDPDRSWLPGSPSGPQAFADPLHDDDHDVHGPWVHQGLTDHYRWHDAIGPLLHSEFGASGATNLPTLRRLAGAADPWPPDASNEVWLHHGSWWHDLPLVRDVFGEPDGIEQYVQASQWLQQDALRYAIDAARRRWPMQAGTIPWQFNEPWPMAACTTAVDHWGHPKPAYWAVRDGYAPDWVGIQLSSPVLPRDGELCASVRAEHVSPADTWSWSLHVALSGETLAHGGGAVPGAPGAVDLGEVRCLVPRDVGAALLRVDLHSAGEVVARRDVLLSTRSEQPLRALLAAPDTRLAVTSGGVRNIGSTSAVGLRIDTQEDWAGLGLAAGYRALVLPGEAVTVRAKRSAPVMVSAWNCLPVHATAALHARPSPAG